MTLLHTLSYGALLVAVLFVTLSLASGLLWLAEVIEEHSRTAKIVGQRTIYAVIAFHILLYTVDANLPFTHVTFSVACHLVYLTNFANFPLISLTSWSFIASCIMVVTDHFLWFFHFHNILDEARKRERRWRHPMEPVPHVPTFLDISTFFGICVWLVPLFLFLSLSANDNALPTASQHDFSSTSTLMPAFDPSQPVPGAKPQRSSLFVSLSTKAMSILPSRRLPRSLLRRNSDGLIVPQSISRPPSPLHPSLTLLSPGYQPRSTSPGHSPTTFMHPSPSLHSPLTTPSPRMGAGAKGAVDAGSLGEDENTTRRRTNLHALPPRRAVSYNT